MNEMKRARTSRTAATIIVLLTALLCTGQLFHTVAQSCVPAPGGLISWYRAEGNVNDEVSGHHGSTPYGITYEVGRVGQAWKNDGFIQSVGLGGGWFIYNDFTIEMWVKAGSTQVENAIIIDNNHSAFQNWVIQSVGGNTFAFGAADNRGLITFTLTPGVWQHLAVTRDSIDTRLYLDGSVVGIKDQGTLINYNNPQIGLGNWHVANGRSFNGSFDEPAFYDRALSFLEIQTIVLAGAAGKCASWCPTITVTGPDFFEPGTVGRPYSPQSITAAGGSMPHTYSITSGVLPAGLQLHPTTGDVWGTPTEPGTSSFTVTATDLNGCTGSRSYSLEVVRIDAFCPLPNGLVAWYPGEDDATDVQGPTFENGTLQNGATFGSGKVDRAFSLDGADDYVDLGNWFDLQTFSIEMWVNPDASQAAHANIVDNNHSGFQSWVVQYNNTGGQFYFGALDGRGAMYFDLTPGAWQHLVITRDVHQTRVYLNGALLETRTGGGNIVYTGSQFLRLGAWGGGGRHFNGQIDEASFYNRALTRSEVSAVYGAGAAGKGCSPADPVPVPSGLIGWWAGDGDRIDTSGNGNSALMHNGAGFAVSRVGQGFVFSGVDDFAVVGSDPIFNTVAGVTLEAWVNTPTPDTSDNPASPMIVGKFGSYLLAKSPTGNPYFQIHTTGSSSIVNALQPLQANIPTHIAGTYDSSTGEVRIYVNGELSNSSTASGDLVSNTNPINIASVNPASFFTGQIDEISLYNRALSTTEIAAIANARHAGKLKAVSTTGTTAAVGDATVTFQTAAARTTHQIQLLSGELPDIPFGTHTGLVYDVGTGGSESNVSVCFRVPSFAPTEFANLRVLHLESGVWVNRTAPGNSFPNLCTTSLASLSTFAIVFAPGGCPTIGFDSTTLADGTVGAGYSQTVTANDGTGPYTYAVTSGSLPTGVSINATTGVISGSPGSASLFSFTVTATDSAGCSGTQEYSIQIACPITTIDPVSLPGGTVGSAYSQMLSASGTGGSYAFSLSGGSLPGGLSLSPSGLLSGTPTADGSFNFTASASDVGAGCGGSRAYSVTIQNIAPSAPTSLQVSAISVSQLNLSWIDNANNETGFSIQRCSKVKKTCNFVQVGQVGANVTTFSDTGLTKGTQYTYRVRAFNTIGNSAFSNNAVGKTLRR